MTTDPPRVFISYAQVPGPDNEPGPQSQWVLELANKLRADGVDAVIDRYFDWLQDGWRRWMTEQIEQAKWVLVICTAEYLERFDGDAPADIGRGVRWESQHITQELYDHKFRNKRFVPVLPPGGDDRLVPVPLKDYKRFRLDDEYEALYRLLTDQPATPAPVLGQIRRLPPLPLPQARKPTSLSGSAAPPQAIANPYPGLAAFKPEDHRFFFGRDEDTARIIQKLGETRLVSVVGPSGTGKSSLVAAGVVPALREKESGLTYLRFKPQANPFRQLAEALDRALPEERTRIGRSRVERIEELLEENPAQAVANHLSRLRRPVLLLADQFEELFTQTPPERAHQFRSVFQALLEPDTLHVVLTLRSEFMHRLMEWLGGPLFASSLVPLDPITQEDRLRAVIVRPGEECGVPVQAEVVSTLLAAAGATRGALPLIALTLQKLFEQRDAEKGLTLDAYKRMGGLEGVVETAAADIEAAIEGKPEFERACERLFAELATVIDEVPTRRTAEVTPLRDDSQVSTLVEALRAQGFLADPDEAHIELAHETLLARWPRLSEWCKGYSNHLSLRRQGEQAAKDWEKSGRRDALRWSWERQKPALQALLALGHLSAQPDPGFADTGIHAWRALENRLEETLRTFLHPEPLRLLGELKSDATPHQRREEIGLRLNQMGDPRRGVGLDEAGLPDIVWIDVRTDVTPSEVTLETGDKFAVGRFQLARYPVTWAQYRAFLEAADGYGEPSWWEGRPRAEQPGDLRWSFGNYPAVNVSWYDAVAYCSWLSAKLDRDIRLPTEWEWQWAAVGDTKQEYPWPGDWNGARANSIEAGIGRTVAVGLYPLGRSPLDIDDMAGNVWEWCLNERAKPTSVSLQGDVSRVLRGGSWYGYPGSCRAAGRYDYGPGARYNHIGFRLCCSSPIE